MEYNMKQEEKELLLADLCTRLPYGVKCQVQEDEYTYVGTLCRIEVDNKNGNLLDFVETISGLDCQVYLTEVKPYLFPLSSMTKEQKIRIRAIQDMGLSYYHLLVDKYNEWHIDYRGLIEKGLALDTTGLNIY